MKKQNKTSQPESSYKNIFPEMEKEVSDFWEKNRIFEKSMEKPGGESARGEDYVFFDGPPFATGEPHYGHIAASIMKDAVPRFWTMNGYRVARKWGWDCHGLPVENLAEKELGLKDKHDIEKMGVEKFNDYCRSIVLRYADIWKGVIKRIGRWVDMENDYRTMDPDYMESMWWVFKSLWDKNLIYPGYKAMHICPRCGTTLSNFEVTQNYKDIKDISATVKFELEDEPGTYVLAWTTTPWTLIGNVALAVGSNVKYVKVKFGEENYILGKEIVRNVFGDKKIEVVEELKSKDLVGKKYKPVFDYYYNDEKLENRENGWKIYAGDFVTTEEGTGIVHIAPAFGEDDMSLGQKYNLPFIQHVDMTGRFTKEVADWPMIEAKPKANPQETDKKIVEELKKQNKLFSSEEYEHSYPHCWRCETPLLNYATNSWFVKVTDLVDRLVKNNQKITWVPEHLKDGRFGKWLEQARDWAISRNRYWGSTLPVWICDQCNEKVVVGSRKELEDLSGQKVDDLHKQFVDKITFKCGKCSGTMKRIPEVFDCWFESGSMPYGQEHYPFENKEKFEANFPANFIAEGIDQTRGWFYTLLVLSTALFNKEMAQNIIANGIVLAEDGQKMSKRLKNYPDPTYIVDQYSADAMRYYLFSSPVLVAENLNFSEEGVKEVFRKVEMILWNVYKFYEMYAAGHKPSVEEISPENILDKWIIARLNQLESEVTKGMRAYNLPKSVRPIGDFINDLSTWYLRRSRDRFKGEDEIDKQAALDTTWYVLAELSKVMSPFMPFIAEELWQKLTGNNFQNPDKSVHLESWPVADDQLEKDSLEIVNDMEKARGLVEVVLAMRDEQNMKVRQPLSSFYALFHGKEWNPDPGIKDLVLDEVNIKEWKQFGDDATGKKEYDAKATKGSEEKNNFVAVIDFNMSDDLKLEGMKRDLVRFVNAMRRDMGLTINDKINFYWQSGGELIGQMFEKLGEEIKKDTLSDNILADIGQAENKKEFKINGEKVEIGIKKL